MEFYRRYWQQLLTVSCLGKAKREFQQYLLLGKVFSVWMNIYWRNFSNGFNKRKKEDSTSRHVLFGKNNSSCGSSAVFSSPSRGLQRGGGNAKPTHSSKNSRANKVPNKSCNCLNHTAMPGCLVLSCCHSSHSDRFTLKAVRLDATNPRPNALFQRLSLTMNSAY